MNEDELLAAASGIVRRNVSADVALACVIWNVGAACLTVRYYVDNVADEGLQGLCDLSLAELTAEFTDVCTGNAECVPASLSTAAPARGVVYLRPDR